MKTMETYAEPVSAASTPPGFTPKSYLSEEEKAECLRQGDLEDLYAEEAHAASEARDSESFWGWMARVELPAHSLIGIKNRHGAEFIRKWGFKDTLAKEKYGADWLEKDYDLCGRIVA